MGLTDCFVWRGLSLHPFQSEREREEEKVCLQFHVIGADDGLSQFLMSQIIQIYNTESWPNMKDKQIFGCGEGI